MFEGMLDTAVQEEAVTRRKFRLFWESHILLRPISMSIQKELPAGGLL
jgi:hypothetical protein